MCAFFYVCTVARNQREEFLHRSKYWVPNRVNAVAWNLNFQSKFRILKLPWFVVWRLIWTFLNKVKNYTASFSSIWEWREIKSPKKHVDGHPWLLRTFGFRFCKNKQLALLFLLGFYNWADAITYDGREQRMWAQ